MFPQKLYRPQTFICESLFAAGLFVVVVVAMQDYGNELKVSFKVGRIVCYVWMYQCIWYFVYILN